MLINGEWSDVIRADDRGLTYGDGVFETIRFVGPMAPLWHRHMQRLSSSCERLHLSPPDIVQLQKEAAIAVQGLSQSILRITVTRGTGERGYAFPLAAAPSRIVAAFSFAPVSMAAYQHGVRVRVCDMRLAEQPALAGIKHLNRLEQVLARAEWSDTAITEGLLCDQRGNVICATAANIFAVIDDAVITPALDRCGVAGVARSELLQHWPMIQIRELPLAECLSASELFLTSSIRGILPVQAVGDTVYGPGPVARAMQAHWRELGFPMEQA